MSGLQTRTSRYFDIKKDASGAEVLEVYLEGIALMRLPLTNKGTAFSHDERRALGIDGLLPPVVNTLEEQVDRAYLAFRQEGTAIGRYQLLRSLQERQEIVFHALLAAHLHEMLPIVYTPTVGEAVQKFSMLYQTARGLSLGTHNIGRAREATATFPMDDVRMIVATDSSAILGIGDQGYGGLAIPIGKLALYTVGGGVSPFQTMPVALDVGTDRRDLIEDPLYLGVRHERLRGEKYLAFIDAFVDAIRTQFPRAIVQWEDLSKDAAFTVLERHRKTLPSFNDDIQGTGAVALAGVLSACKLKGESIADQRIVVHGAGAGGVGVASAMRDGMVRAGLSREEATARIFVLDSKGLLTDDRALEEYKRPFGKPRVSLAGWSIASKFPSLVETITNAKATVLLGLSGQAGCFDEPVAKAMLACTPSPIIFPLSNPTSSCEAAPEDLLRWTHGAALVATGSPFSPVEIDGRTITIGQGNNAFIFPGLGLGAILANAREITDGMVLASAYALADYTAEHNLQHGLIYPPVDALREVSARVGAKVLEAAYADGVAQAPRPTDADWVAFVRASMWTPRYLPIVRG